MNLSIGANIKRKRLERGLTQEEVASHIGVSFQTVSKWERGDGYPDIEMLPAIANYFSVSVDELLGVSDVEKKNIYDEINSKWSYNNKNGFHQENVLLMKDGLKKFPNDALLLVQLSTSLEKINGTEEEKEKNLRESIEVQEQIIKFCEDCEVRGATLYNICFAYWKIGEKEKAIAQARKLPNLYKSRENALVYFLENDEKNETAREALEPLAWVITHHMTALYETENDVGYLKKALKIVNTIFDDKDKNEFIQIMCKSLENKINEK